MGKLRYYGARLRRYLISEWKSLLRLMLAVFAMVTVTNMFFVQVFRVLQISMVPTLYEGDSVMVSKWSYGYSRASFPKWLIGIVPDMDRFLVFDTPQRGDVVVIYGRDYDQTYVKRVIGLPGDIVQMIDGRIWINGYAAPQMEYHAFAALRVLHDREYDEPRLDELPANIGRDDVKVESIPGGSQYYIVDQAVSPLDNTPEFVVPEGYYFVVGDNRDDSSDSRLFHPRGLGFISFNNFVGKVMWSRTGILPRFWHRMNIGDDQQ